MRGIDVSKYQGNIDWSKVKSDGIEFAMVRLGFGFSTLDPYFEANVAGAQEQGIKVGAYHYSYALSPDDARREADFVLLMLKNYRLEFPVAIDIEDASQAALGKDTLTNIVTAFCEKIEAAGWWAMIYASTDWLTNKLDLNKLTRFAIWRAHWTTASIYSLGEGIWQYANNGSVNGIKGNVDMNIAYTDYSVPIIAHGLNGWPKNIDAAPTPTVVSTSKENLYRGTLTSVKTELQAALSRIDEALNAK